MSPQGFIQYPLNEWDVGLCVSKGQVFRWKECDDGWLGVDADHVLWLRAVVGGYEFATLPVPGRDDWIRAAFQLDVSLQNVERRVAEVEPSLTELANEFLGLRVMQWASAEECLFSFMCSVNNHIPRITAMIDRLSEAHGEALARGLRRFPSTQRLAALDPEDLWGLGFGYRSRTIVAAARAVAERPEGWLEGLRKVPYAEAHSALRELPSVGNKVADCVCLFGLWHGEAVPVDTHLWQECCDRYFPEWKGKALTDKRYEIAGAFFRDRWGDLAGWAHQYLFYSRLFRKGSARKAGKLLA